jgi:HEAT repeat protein
MAARWLCNLEDLRAVEPLVVALKDEDLHVRTAAAGSLGRIGDPRAVPALEELLSKEKDADVRRAARDAIKAIRDKAPPASHPSK